MKSPKIALIDPVGIKAGLDNYSTGLLSALIELGRDGILYSNFHWQEHPEISFPYFSEKIAHSYSEILLRPLKYLKIIRHAIAQGCTSVIIHVFHFNRMDEWLLKKLKQNKLKSIVIIHDVESFVHQTDKSRLKRICEGLADVLVVHSKFISDELSFLISKHASSKIQIIPHGDFLAFASDGISKMEARAKLNLDLEKPVVLFFGMIKPNKGLDTLLHSWKNVQSDSQLIVAGRMRNGSFEKYQEIIDSAPTTNNVKIFLRHIMTEERDLLFRAADMIILPYTKIYQSGVLLMAMSYGIPVIASKIKGFEEILKDKFNALLFEPGNSMQLSEAISSLSRDHQLQKNLQKML